MAIPTCMHDWGKEDINIIIKAFTKVWSQLDALRAYDDAGNE